MNRKVLRTLITGLLIVAVIGSVGVPIAIATFVEMPDGGQPSGGTPSPTPTPTPDPNCGDGGQPSGGTC